MFLARQKILARREFTALSIEHCNHLGSQNNADLDPADLGWSLRWHISRGLPEDADDRGHTLSGLRLQGHPSSLPQIT